MRSTAVFAAIAAAFVAVAWSPALLAGEAEDKAYTDMLTEALQHPADVDYVTFRTVYAASSYYEKRASDPMNIVAMGTDATVEMLKSYVYRNYPLINAQIVAMDERLAPKGTDRHQMHLLNAVQILQDLTEVYDGKSAETAIPVLVVSEEYVVAQFMRVTVKSQALIVNNGKHYDRLSGVDEKGAAAELWFDISAFFGD